MRFYHIVIKYMDVTKLRRIVLILIYPVSELDV